MRMVRRRARGLASGSSDRRGILPEIAGTRRREGPRVGRGRAGPWYTRLVKTPARWRGTFLLLAISGVVVMAQPQAPRVPVPPIRTSLGSMPEVAELPSRPAMPDVLVSENGDRVKTAAQWAKRREEMKRILAYYATGLTPPAPGN